MTRKDYEKIARVLREYKSEADSHSNSPWRNTARVELVSRIADMLALDNPRFDRTRFLKACNIEK